jgi:uncharacterized membrane protein
LPQNREKAKTHVAPPAAAAPIGARADVNRAGTLDIDRLIKSFAAGLAGTAAHVVLMYLKDRLGLLAQFQPYEEFQRALSLMTGAAVSPSVAWLMTFVNGALVWGFIFGRLFARLPGRTPLRKGLFFALCAWAMSGLVFFPLLGRGVFAWKLGLGATPAALMLVMLCCYCLAMSFAWDALTRRPAYPPRSARP